MLSLFKMTPEHSAEGLSSIPKCKKAVMYLTEKEYVSDKLPSVMSYTVLLAVNVSSVLMSQQYIVNKVDLKKHI